MAFVAPAGVSVIAWCPAWFRVVAHDISARAAKIKRAGARARTAAQASERAGGRRYPFSWAIRRPIAGQSTRQQAAYDLGGVVNHGDDPGIVQTGRPDHADHADDSTGTVAIRCDDGRGP